MRLIDADELMRKMGVESLKYDNANIKHGFYKSMVLVADADAIAIKPQPGNGGWKYYLGKCVCKACGAEFDEISPYCPKCGTFNGGE